MHDKPTSDRLLNEREVADLTVSVATIRRWRLRNQGPRYFKVGAAVRYKLEEVISWLNSRPVGGEVANERSRRG